jgi:hypothetical protein
MLQGDDKQETAETAKTAATTAIEYFIQQTKR